MITQEQIDEWTDNPVTRELKALAIEVMEDIDNARKQAYAPGDPQRTQETLAIAAGAYGAWDTLVEALEGDWEFMKAEQEVIDE